jgi:hypothetical protein
LAITYEDPSNEEKEKSFFESFKSLAQRIPVGSWEYSGRCGGADYILDTPTRRYGLEITTLTNPTLAGIRDAQDKCLNVAGKLAGNRGIPPLAVEVGFRDNRRPINSIKNAQALVTFVEGKLHYLDDTGSFYTDE